MWKFLSALLFLASLAAGQEVDFATNLADCVAVKPLDTCLNQTLEELRSLMPYGIKSLGIRRTEPLEIRKLDFSNADRGNKPVLLNITTNFRNVVVRGLSTFRTNYISADTSRRAINLSITVPRLTITGLYRATGDIGFFRVTGNGNFESLLEGVTGTGGARIIPVRREDGTYALSVADADIDFQIARSNLKLNADKDRELFEAVSGFINSNSQLLIDQVKPEIRSRMKVMVEKVLNDAFRKIPADQLLENIDRSGSGRSGSFGGGNSNFRGGGGGVRQQRTGRRRRPFFRK